MMINVEGCAKMWMHNRKFHRLFAPCYITLCKCEEWQKYGKRHREDGGIQIDCTKPILYYYKGITIFKSQLPYFFLQYWNNTTTQTERMILIFNLLAKEKQPA